MDASTQTTFIGSEKQIEWASDIRQSVLAQIEKTLAPYDVIVRLTVGAWVQAEVSRVNSAQWWIDHRNVEAVAEGFVLTALLREAPADRRADVAEDGFLEGIVLGGVKFSGGHLSNTRDLRLRMVSELLSPEAAREIAAYYADIEAAS